MVDATEMKTIGSIDCIDTDTIDSLIIIHITVPIITSPGWTIMTHGIDRRLASTQECLLSTM